MKKENEKILKKLFWIKIKKLNLDKITFVNETYLSCIISYTEKISYGSLSSKIYKLNLYEITFLNANENNQDHFISKREYFNKTYVDSYGASYIANSSSTCQISSNILYCFYFIDESKKVRVSGFDLSKNYEEINYNDIFYEEGNRNLYEIKSFDPSNSNSIFLSYYGLFFISLVSGYPKQNYIESHCISYNIQEKKFSIVGNVYYYDCNNFQPYYFEETNQYIIGCINFHKGVKAFLLNESFGDVTNEYLDPLICDDIYNYLIYYNTTTLKYNLIKDCYIKNNDSVILANHTLFIEDETNYIMEHFHDSTDEEIENNSDENSNLNDDMLSSDSSSINEDKSDDNEKSDEKSNINNDDTLLSDSSANSNGITDKINNIDLNISKNEIIDNISIILNKTDIGENYEINGKDLNLIIKPTNSSFHDNSTHVNFQNCEDILRKHYNIPNSTILTFVQLEVNNNEENSLINPVEYEVYDDKKNRLNLSVCNNTDIEIVHSIKDKDLSFISYFLDSNINIFNIHDSFYHDICKAYYNSKHDIILKDRILDFYQKYGLCEEGCSYNEFNKEYKTISCSCKTKTKMTKKELTVHVQSYDGMNIKSIFINTDFSIIKCYKVVFSLVGKSINIGFWIFLILVTTHIPFIFIYFCKGIETIKKYIIREMTKNRYISIHHISK